MGKSRDSKDEEKRSQIVIEELEEFKELIKGNEKALEELGRS